MLYDSLSEYCCAQCGQVGKHKTLEECIVALNQRLNDVHAQSDTAHRQLVSLLNIIPGSDYETQETEADEDGFKPDESLLLDDEARTNAAIVEVEHLIQSKNDYTMLIENHKEFLDVLHLFRRIARAYGVSVQQDKIMHPYDLEIEMNDLNKIIHLLKQENSRLKNALNTTPKAELPE